MKEKRGLHGQLVKLPYLYHHKGRILITDGVSQQFQIHQEYETRVPSTVDECSIIHTIVTVIRNDFDKLYL